MEIRAAGGMISFPVVRFRLLWHDIRACAPRPSAFSARDGRRADEDKEHIGKVDERVGDAVRAARDECPEDARMMMIREHAFCIQKPV